MTWWFKNEILTNATPKVEFGHSLPAGKRVHRVDALKIAWLKGGDHPWGIFRGEWKCGKRFAGKGTNFILLESPPPGIPLCADCEHPERRVMRANAHKLTTRAIKNGRLTRLPCEKCGLEPGRRDSKREWVLAHHDNYAKPLDVRWLCNSCHGEWHRQNQAVYA